ncbi:hypothetical protein AAVH_36252 [Aphelenchoides avenae]|nr:hypothetical protein AAVH_36252 [Aphelenchus avenae]
MSTPQLSGVDFLHKSYRYWLARQGESDALWYCCKRAADCQARLLRSLKSGKDVEEMNHHNHPPTESAETTGLVASTKGSPSGPIAAATAKSPADCPTTVTELTSGKTRLRHKSYVFCLDRTPTNGAKQYWRCKNKFSSHCMARLHTTASGKVLLEVSEHNHPPTYAMTKKDSGSRQDDTPKTCHRAAKRRTLSANCEQSSKKRRTSAIVETKKSSSPSNATPSPVNSTTISSTFALAQRLMGLPPAKRVSAASLFSSLLDEMESDVKTEH